MLKKWRVNKKFPAGFKKRFPEYSETVCQLLYDRGIKNRREANEFFNPDYEQDLHDPYLMKDMDKAVERIFEAIDKKEKITVYGDYDVDGVTSGALVVKMIDEMRAVFNGGEKTVSKNIFTGIYIPDREEEGYGLNEKALAEIAENGTKLIITVDCGISNYNGVEKAKKMGMDIVITDHHSVPEKTPRAIAIINPKQKDCSYPFKELAGVGVAFKLAQALYRKLETEKPILKNPPNPLLQKENSLTSEKWLLDLVALGTVADCVELIGENRTLVKYGLLVLEKTRRPGLKTLIENSVSGGKNNNGGKGAKFNRGTKFCAPIKIDTYTIGYILAPRLNAAGRMDHANTSYQLLITEDEKEAGILAAKLDASNRERQKVTEKIIARLEKRIDKKYSPENLPKIILESDPEWKIGVVGLVAGKLTDKFSRPVIILKRKEKVSAGSGRSVPRFNLINAISACQDLLIEFGGHSQAAGLKIENSNLEKFYQKIKKIANGQLSEENLIPEISISKEISPADIDWNLYNQINEFQPFGTGNKKPIFLVKELEIVDAQGVGANGSEKYGKHLRLSLKSHEEIKFFKAICFNQGKMIKKIKTGDLVDLVFSLEINEWNGNKELQLNVADVRVSSS